MARKQLQNLTEPMYYILLSLIEPRHGYAVMQNIRVITEDRVKVGPGTLYALMSRFEKEEIVVKLATEESKKTYQLTEKGKIILEQEIERLKQLVIDANRVMGGERA